MINFIKAFLVFLLMYREGFFWSKNDHYGKDKTHWGFYHLNHKACPEPEYAIVDIDFNFCKKDSYFNVHGENGIVCRKWWKR